MTYKLNDYGPYGLTGLTPVGQPAPWEPSYIPMGVPEPNNAQPFNETRRIIDLETKVAKLEATIEKLTGEKL
jgi:hypothetical protein